MKKSRPNILAVANQKGGVGKTTTVVSLASAFARMNYRVLVVDFDFQGNASDWMGVQDKAVEQKRTVTSAIQKNLTIGDIRVPTANENIDVIVSEISLNWEIRKLNGTSRQFQLLKKIVDSPEANDYQMIIVDTHPSIDALFESVMGVAHYFLVPVFAEKHPYSGLEYLMKAIEQIKEDVNPMLHFLGILVTKYNKDNTTHRRFEIKMRELENSTRVPVLKTVIPSSEAIPGAAASRQSLLDYNTSLPISEAYIQLANELIPMLKGKRTGRPQHTPKIDRADVYQEFFSKTTW